MSLTCAISGEPLLGNHETNGSSNNNNNNNHHHDDEIVVTPSGHVCIKRLLLAKLTENGGMDPFENDLRDGGRPLSEDQLIVLNTSSSSSSTTTTSGSSSSSRMIPPRPSSTSSFPTLLKRMQQEYDALILELFDTRKALEETRRELSQALYQNDAAIRVVARISMERDQARQELQRWNATVGGTTTTTATTMPPPAPQQPTTTIEQNDWNDKKEPSAKRQKVVGDESKDGSTLDLPLTNDIPQDHQQTMIDTWSKLHKERKPILKAAAANAPTMETLTQKSIEEMDSKSWHKTSCRGIQDMTIGYNNNNNNNNNNKQTSSTTSSTDASYIVTASKGNRAKQIVIYNIHNQVISYSITPFASMSSVAMTKIDVQQPYVLIGGDNGRIELHAMKDDKEDTPQLVGHVSIMESKTTSSSIVDVRLCPTQQHFCAATANGQVVLGWIQSNSISIIAIFSEDGDNNNNNNSSHEYTCGALHPDGLIYAAGTKTGQIHMWDFKNKVLASKLEGEHGDAVLAIDFSNNGYHVATAHASAKVCAWDLRKQKTLAILNDKGNADGSSSTSSTSSATILDSVSRVAYDPSGKYLAFGGTNGHIHITTVKEWGITASLKPSSTNKKPPNNLLLTGLIWNNKNVNDDDDDQQQQQEQDENKAEKWLIAACTDQERTVRFYCPTSNETS